MPLAMLLAPLVLAAVFVVGGVNFTVALAALGWIRDPRLQASGNPGVSNVYRTAGPQWAALVLGLDVGRAVGVALLCVWLVPAVVAPWGGFALVLGNVFPVFHGLKGGKGVANHLGFTVGLAPLWGGLAALVWPLSYAVLRRTYLCSFLMVAALGAIGARRFGYHPSALLAAAATTGLIVWAHRSNLRHRKTTGGGHAGDGDAGDVPSAGE